MESNYAAYLRELNTKDLYEDENGFLVYSINGDYFQLEEIFVKREMRNKGIASSYIKLAEEMAKEIKCKYLRGYIIAAYDKSTESIQFHMNRGFRLEKVVSGIIYIVKEV